MVNVDLRPTCATCHFSKVDLIMNGFANIVEQTFCMKEPKAIRKQPDDFCRHHPAWPEFELRVMGDAISDYHALQEISADGQSSIRPHSPRWNQDDDLR